jgi:hypothetical protein
MGSGLKSIMSISEAIAESISGVVTLLIVLPTR